jgi:hypothetical protein
VRGERCAFTLKNTGASAPTDASAHPQDGTAFLDDDIYRLSATAAGPGWSADLPNALAMVKFGESQSVAVHVNPGRRGATGSLTLKAVSESDTSKSATATCSVTSVN